MGSTAHINFDVEPELTIADLWLVSAHVSGRIIRWRIVIRKDLTVAQLLDTLVSRSQATETPLMSGAVVLAELIHSRLHRILRPEMKLDLLREDDVLVAYEVPILDPSGVSGDLMGCTVEAAMESSTAAGDGFHTVVCHPRFEREKLSFFCEEGESACLDLVGIPLMFRVRAGLTQQRMYDIVEAGLYGSRSFTNSSRLTSPLEKPVEKPFSLYFCERSRMLTSGGRKLDSSSSEAMPLSELRGDEEPVVALAVQWPEGCEHSPWLLQQAGSVQCRRPDSFLEAIVGVDFKDLTRQMQQLKTERKDLLEELRRLRKWQGTEQELKRSARGEDHFWASGRLGGGYTVPQEQDDF